LAAMSGRPDVFIIFFALGMFSDCVDGFVARRLHQTSPLGAKFCTTAVSISLLLVFLGISRWPFRLCVPLLVLESIQEIAMVLILPRWHPNLPTLWHALRQRSES
jgi:phosphatidylglycerophosphate synthase